MKSVVITGSARGLGFELAKCFRNYNYNVLLSDLNIDNLNKAKEKLENEIKSESIVEVKVCNVTNFDDLVGLKDYAIEKFSNIDVWINNAGINQRDVPVYGLSETEISLMLDVDLKGAILGSKIAYEFMKNQGHGQIYSIDGYGSNDAYMTGLSLYGTSKRGLKYFMKALANEAKELGDKVLIGRLSPGIMITDFLTNSNNDKTKNVLSEKTKKVYNILGDYPDVIAKFLVDKIVKNEKNDVCFTWLTNFKAFRRFMTAGFNKRDFFKEK